MMAEPDAHLPRTGEEIDMTAETAKWKCPTCSRAFRRTGQKHVCASLTVDHLFGSASDHSKALFERFTALVHDIGAFEHSITKSGVGFSGTRRVFAAVRPTRSGLGGFIDLTYQVDDARFTKVEPYTKRLFIHKLALDNLNQLDTQFAEWLADAYRVGAGEHMT